MAVSSNGGYLASPFIAPYAATREAVREMMTAMNAYTGGEHA